MLKSSKTISTATATINTESLAAKLSQNVVEIQSAEEHKPLNQLAVKKSLQLINPSDIQSMENLGDKYSGVLQNLSSSLATSDTKLKSMGGEITLSKNGVKVSNIEQEEDIKKEDENRNEIELK